MATEDAGPPPQPPKPRLPPLSAGSLVYVLPGVSQLRGCVVARGGDWQSGLAEVAGEAVVVASHSPPMVQVRWQPADPDRDELVLRLPDAALSLQKAPAPPPPGPLSPLRRRMVNVRAPGRSWVKRKAKLVFGVPVVQRAASAADRTLLADRAALEKNEGELRVASAAQWWSVWLRLTSGVYAFRKGLLERRESERRAHLMKFARGASRPLLNVMQKGALGAEHASGARRQSLVTAELLSGFAVSWPEDLPLPSRARGGRVIIVGEQRLMRARLTDWSLRLTQQATRDHLERVEITAAAAHGAHLLRDRELVHRVAAARAELASRHNVQRVVHNRKETEQRAVHAEAEAAAWVEFCRHHVSGRNVAGVRALCRVEEEHRAAEVATEQFREQQPPGSWQRLVRQESIEISAIHVRAQCTAAEVPARISVQTSEEASVRHLIGAAQQVGLRSLTDGLSLSAVTAAERLARDRVEMEHSVLLDHLGLSWPLCSPLPDAGGCRVAVAADERRDRARLAARAFAMHELGRRCRARAEELTLGFTCAWTAVALQETSERLSHELKMFLATEAVRRKRIVDAARVARGGLRRGYAMQRDHAFTITESRDEAEAKRYEREEWNKLLSQGIHAPTVKDRPGLGQDFVQQRAPEILDPSAYRRAMEGARRAAFAARVQGETDERTARGDICRQSLYYRLHVMEMRETDRRPAVEAIELASRGRFKWFFALGKAVACDAAHRRVISAQWSELLGGFAVKWPSSMRIPACFPGGRVLLLREERQSRAWAAGDYFNHDIRCNYVLVLEKEHLAATFSICVPLIAARAFAHWNFLTTEQRVGAEEIGRSELRTDETSDAREIFWRHVDERYKVGVFCNVRDEERERRRDEEEEHADFTSIVHQEKLERERYWRNFWGAMLTPTVAAAGRFNVLKRQEQALVSVGGGPKEEVADWGGDEEEEEEEAKKEREREQKKRDAEVWARANKQAKTEPWNVSMDGILRARVAELVSQGACQGRSGGVSLKLVREHLEGEFGVKLNKRKADVEKWVVGAVGPGDGKSRSRSSSIRVPPTPARRGATATGGPTEAQLRDLAEKLVAAGDCTTASGGVSLRLIRRKMETEFRMSLEPQKKQIEQFVTDALSRLAAP